DADECFTIQSCKPGLVCVDGASVEGCTADTCCTQYCDTDDGNAGSTDNNELCKPYFDAGTSPPGYANVGVCAVPTGESPRALARRAKGRPRAGVHLFADTALPKNQHPSNTHALALAV